MNIVLDSGGLFSQWRLLLPSRVVVRWRGSGLERRGEDDDLEKGFSWGKKANLRCTRRY